MSTLPEGLTQAEVDRFLQLDEGIKALDKERKTLSDKIKAALGVGTYVFGDVMIERSEAIGLDTATFTEAFPASEHPDLYKQVPDTKAIPDAIKGEHFTLTQRVSAKRVK